MNGIVYLFKSKINGMGYVGQTYSPTQRFEDHKYCQKRGAFHRAILEFGFDSFEYFVLHENIKTREELFLLEKEEIKKQNTLYPNGYNMNEGGQDGKYCDAMNKMQSKIKKEYFSNPENRKRFTDIKRKTLKPIICLTNGKTYISIAAACRDTGLIKQHVISCCQDKVNHTGGLVFRYLENGKPKEYIRKENKKNRAVFCIDTNEIFMKIKDAAKKYSLNPSAVRMCCIGVTKTCGGKKWRYHNAAS
jgi:predicted GIY-YIG superfamily endonuclease